PVHAHDHVDRFRFWLWQQEGPLEAARYSMRNSSRKTRRSGFTLIELLVVIFIIGILMAIAVPIVGKVRKSAYAANTAAQINALRAGAEAYCQTFGAYPGPLADLQMYNGTPP